jgi:DNA-binding LacI/PurR family transcriptional regulator
LLSPFFYEAVKGALKAAKQKGWLVTILGFQGQQEELALLQSTLEQRSVDGVLLFDPQDDDPRLPLLKGRLPFVVVGRCSDPEVVTVDNDNVQAAKLATQHLLQLGHRRIAFVHVPFRFATAQDRLMGYRMALEEAGLPFDANLLAGTEGYYGVEAGYRAFLGLLNRLRKPPTAVLAMDDTLALGVLQAAQQHGLRVPDDLAVVGFNDSPFAAHCEPPLTTVRIFAETLVEYATDALLRLIRGEPVAPKRMLVPTQLIVRASCGAMSRKNN